MRSMAWGSCIYTKRIHKEMLVNRGITKKVTKYTYDDTGVPCAMVDSNGTEYTSTDWESVIRVPGFFRHGNIKFVTFELICRDGQQ